MDAERQPLLSQLNTGQCYRRCRPLSYEEVTAVHHEVTWRRTRCLLILVFWAIMAMFLSIIACILVTAPPCGTEFKTSTAPTVPPVHMTMASLISQTRAIANNESNFYAI